MNPEEYLVWEAPPFERHELIDGRIYAMSSGTKNHRSIAINILLLLRNHLCGKSCSVFNSDLKGNILHAPNYTYPDLSITYDDCDREPLDITYPYLIVEVLSISTEACDQGKKFEKHHHNPNLVNYVLGSSEEIAIDIYHKNSDGAWLILSCRSGDQVELQSIGLSLPIEQFYEEISFDVRVNE